MGCDGDLDGEERAVPVGFEKGRHASRTKAELHALECCNKVGDVVQHEEPEYRVERLVQFGRGIKQVGAVNGHSTSVQMADQSVQQITGEVETGDVEAAIDEWDTEPSLPASNIEDAIRGPDTTGRDHPIDMSFNVGTRRRNHTRVGERFGIEVGSLVTVVFLVASGVADHFFLVPQAVLRALNPSRSRVRDDVALLPTARS